MLELKAPISPEFIEQAFQHCNEYNANLYAATDKYQWSINSILKICILFKPGELVEQEVAKGIPADKPPVLFDPDVLEIMPTKCRYEIVDQHTHKTVKTIYVASHTEDCLDFFTIEEGELLYSRIPKYIFKEAMKKRPQNAVAMSMTFSVVDNADPEDVIEFTNLINTDIPDLSDTDIRFIPQTVTAPIQ